MTVTQARTASADETHKRHGAGRHFVLRAAAAAAARATRLFRPAREVTEMRCHGCEEDAADYPAYPPVVDPAKQLGTRRHPEQGPREQSSADTPVLGGVLVIRGGRCEICERQDRHEQRHRLGRLAVRGSESIYGYSQRRHATDTAFPNTHQERPEHQPV